jgi:hypothetical protein
MIPRTRSLLLALILGLCSLWLFTSIGAATTMPVTHIKVYNRSWGNSSHYIGACEGNVRFDVADMLDLGINTYRLYGGMSRWETTDDDDAYGLPTIAQIKANPDLIPWEHWDEVMEQPASGTDYAFSGIPQDLWQGNASTIFQTLKAAHIRPVVTIRNTDPGWGPDWALGLNRPRSREDWNEWWEHVFATVYWLNVRHDYGVDDFEIHNEPDNRAQGWGGSQADYFKLVDVATDAIEHVYQTYLPDRVVHIHAPKTTGGSDWPQKILAKTPRKFNTINVHDYDWNIADYLKRVRGWMQRTIHARSPLWLGEWGTYTTKPEQPDSGYNDLGFSLNLIKNMIRMSQPEINLYGSHIFSLYDWGRDGSLVGLINATGDRRLAYYAFRMGIRALQSGKRILVSTPSDLMTIVTQANEDPKTFYVLIVNDQPQSRQVDLDVSALLKVGTAMQREFSVTNLDEIIDTIPIEQGQMQFDIPAQTSQMIVLTKL